MSLLLLSLILGCEPTPRATLAAFIEAMNRRDPLAMAQRVAGDKPHGMKKLPMPFPTFEFKVGKESLNGDTATVEVEWSTPSGNGIGSGDGETGKETIRLRKEGDDWKIVPGVTPPREASHLVEIMVSFIADERPFVEARKRAEREACVSMAKQMAIMVTVYVIDHDERFPPKNRFFASMGGYHMEQQNTTCPNDHSGNRSYFFEPRLAGLDPDKIAYPERTAMIVEGFGGKPIFRHEGKAAVAFVDGSARLLTPAELAKARTIPLKRQRAQATVETVKSGRSAKGPK